jgi:anaerobic selenocysteine-containing dehydrogenase
LRSNNSWMHNSERLVKGGERCTLLLHPADAQQYGIEDGEMVDVTSATGTISIKAEVKEDMMPGVVSIPHGWGHARTGVKMEVAQAHPGVSINDLTIPGFVDQLSGNAAFSGVPVRVRKI